MKEQLKYPATDEFELKNNYFIYMLTSSNGSQLFIRYACVRVRENTVTAYLSFIFATFRSLLGLHMLTHTPQLLLRSSCAHTIRRCVPRSVSAAAAILPMFLPFLHPCTAHPPQSIPHTDPPPAESRHWHATVLSQCPDDNRAHTKRYVTATTRTAGGAPAPGPATPTRARLAHGRATQNERPLGRSCRSSCH